MGHKFDLLKAVGVRYLLASPLFAIQIWMMHSWGPFGVIPGLVFGFIGALIVAPRLLDLLAEPFRAIVYPLRRFDKPVPMYGVAQAKRAKGDYEGALAYYEGMEKEYPGDMEVYRGMLELLVLEMKDSEKASEAFQRALRVLKTPAQKEGLARIYEGMRAQVKGKPDWLVAQQARVLQTNESDGSIVEEPDGVTKRRFHSGGHRSREVAD